MLVVREAGPEVEFEIEQGSPQPGFILPGWAKLAAGQARWTTAELGAAGTLVVPRNWRSAPGSAGLLRAWADLGWRFVDLPTAFAALGPTARLLGADGLRARIVDPAVQAVVGNGAEAASVLGWAERIADQMIEALGADLATAWRRDYDWSAGWYLRQRVAHGLHQALHDRQTETTLGAAGDPLVRLPDSGAAEQFSALTGMTVRARVPRLPAVSWWRDVARQGFLSKTIGGEAAGAFDWQEHSNVLLVGPDSGPLGFFLQCEGLRPQKMQPSRLDNLEEVAVELEAWMPLPADPRPPPAPRPQIGPKDPTEELELASVVDAAAAAAAEKPATGASKVAKELAERLRRLAEGKGSDEKPKKRAGRKSKAAAADKPAPPGPTEPEGAPEPASAAKQGSKAKSVRKNRSKSAARRASAAADAGPAEQKPTSEKDPRWSAKSPDPEAEQGPLLADFAADRFVLDLPHPAGQVRVLVDGGIIPAENVHARQEPGRRSVVRYELTSSGVRSGSLVRIDLEALPGGGS